MHLDKVGLMVFMAGSSLLVVVHILYNVHISVEDWRLVVILSAVIIAN